MRNPWVFLLLSSAALLGQSSGIQGIVSDPTAAPVPEVKVIVTNVDIGVPVTATTNEHGFYTAPFLQKEPSIPWLLNHDMMSWIVQSFFLG